MYGYGIEGQLSIIASGDSADTLCNVFMMKSSISGSQFNGLGSIDIYITGHVVNASEDSEAGTDLGTVCGMINQQYNYHAISFSIIRGTAIVR